jgi:hypothetical protein
MIIKKTNAHTATVPMLSKRGSSIFLGKILANNPYKRNPLYPPNVLVSKSVISVAPIANRYWLISIAKLNKKL